jgi:hypothetical protein
MAGLNALISGFVDWLLPSRRFRVTELVDAADEIPDQLPRRGAVLVGTLDQPTWIAFDCPCMDHHRVMLNLDPRRHPAWVIGAKKPLTLSPSINEKRRNIRCHYFIRAGRVQWAHNADMGTDR